MTFKRGKFKVLANDPGGQHPGESHSSYALFKTWLDSDGSMPLASLAAENGLQLSTLQRYRRAQKWEERLLLYRQKNNQRPQMALPMTTVDEDIQNMEEKPTQIDPIDLRIANAMEVAEQSYLQATMMHQALYKLAQQAIDRLDVEDLTSISEIKQVVQLTNDLAKARIEGSEQINGIQALAKAVADLRKQRRAK